MKMTLLIQLKLYDFSGFVDLDKVDDYLTHRENYVRKGKGAVFVDAVLQMDNYIYDPKVY